MPAVLKSLSIHFTNYFCLFAITITNTSHEKNNNECLEWVFQSNDKMLETPSRPI